VFGAVDLCWPAAALARIAASAWTLHGGALFCCIFHAGDCTAGGAASGADQLLMRLYSVLNCTFIGELMGLCSQTTSNLGKQIPCDSPCAAFGSILSRRMCWCAVPQLLWIDVLQTAAHKGSRHFASRKMVWEVADESLSFHLQLRRAEACVAQPASCPSVKQV